MAHEEGNLNDLRAILGNDVAIKAYREKKLPYPDGTIIVDIPEAELTELRRHKNATKWPDRETVTDESQGVRLATIQELARYWATDYNWRKCEAKLNALPQIPEVSPWTQE